MLDNPLVRDLSRLGDDRVTLNDGGDVVLPDHVADVVQVLDVPLAVQANVSPDINGAILCTYQRLLALRECAQSAREHRDARIDTDEPARFIVHLDVVVTCQKSDWCRHYKS